MLGIKRLYIYLLKSYLITFFATFCVCLFIVLMQFLWKYVDDMVGKGLEMSVLFEFFYYAALSLIPMALPLSILLSSLMAFGSLGENLELLAMKASGISLFRIMRPYIMLITLISVGAFFYADNVLPYIQKQLYILGRSMTQKSPAIEIPEGSFYQGIPDVSVYVRHKDKDNLLRDLMIYDFSNGATSNDGGYNADNISITCADSGRLQTSEDKKNLVLTLYNGETFENMRQRNTQANSKTMPYRRETFTYKQLLIDFDTNWKEVDASITSNKYVGKDMKQLTRVIDSLAVVSENLANQHAAVYKNERYFDRRGGGQTVRLDTVAAGNVDWHALLSDQSKDIQRAIYDDAASQASQNMYEMEFYYGEKDQSVDRNSRRHDIERHRKVTMSVACLLFFFIGAPLGAIIRKGGLGTPIVISVLIFILYYVIDNSGYKLAREGVWYVWSGIWMSSGVLLALGAFLTYQAASDSMVNITKETFIKYLPKIFRKKSIKTELDGNRQQD